MRKIGYAVLLVIALVEGFFVSEFLHLRRENDELKGMASESLRLAEMRGDIASSCLSSLTSCSHIIDMRNPQINDQMMKQDSKRTQLAQQRGARGPAQEGPN